MRLTHWLAAAIGLSAACASADVWMADDRFVHRLSPGLDAVELSIDAPHSKALAVDPRDSAVWILSKSRISRRSRLGIALFDSDLKSLRMEDATYLSLDARDGSVWLGEGEGSERDSSKGFIRLDSSGQVSGILQLQGNARALSVALDGSVWILGQKRLLHYTATGSLLADVDLKPLVNGEPKLLQVDSIGAWLWASAEKRLIRIDAHGLASTPLSTELPKQPHSIALDSIRGTLWALSEQRLDAVSVSGSPGAAVDLKSLGIKQPGALAFDPATRAILVGHGAGLSRFGPDGKLSSLVSNPRRIHAVGVAPLTIETALALAAPNPGALTNNPLVPIALQLRASCSGSDCGIEAGFYEGYSLSVLLSGLQVGLQFTIDRDTGLATYQPSSRLPEGTISLTATTTDGFGQASNELAASFTIDTTPSSFLSLSPPSPHLTNRTRVPVSGRLSEPSSLMIGAAVVPVAADGTFAAEQDVSEGLNAIVPQAIDPAGNHATQSISVTRDTMAPKFTSLTPPDGSVLGAAALAISGNIDEPADIALG